MCGYVTSMLLQGELIDGEPLFPGESDIDQLYLIQRMLGEIIIEHRTRFLMHPANAGITFQLREPETLEKHFEGAELATDALAFLQGLLHLDPKKRLAGRQCLQHPYLRDLSLADTELESH
jgi:cyclin-dependent kinase-like